MEQVDHGRAVEERMRISELLEEITSEKQQLSMLSHGQLPANRGALERVRLANSSENHFVCHGEFFLKKGNKDVLKMLEENIRNIEKEIASLMDSLGRHIRELRELNPDGLNLI